MKSLQTWGWLAAGVLAAGLNASYHDGGLAWAHRVADHVEEATTMVRDLASGRTDLFLTEARLFLGHEEADSSRLATTLVRVQTRLASQQTQLARGQAYAQEMSSRRQSALDRAQAERDRMEAQRQRLEARLAELHIPANLTAISFTPPRPPCPRVHVRVPRMTMMNVPASAIHVEVATDPI